MEIIAPRNFRDAREVPAEFAGYDPRLSLAATDRLVINLGGCAVVEPAAMLWCVVCLLLAKDWGLDCSLILPYAKDAASPLIQAGMPQMLSEEGVAVESLPLAAPGDAAAAILLPATRFRSLGDAAELTNRLEDALTNSGMGSANVHPVVCEVFSELANNAAEHSASPIGAYGFAGFYDSGRDRRFLCAVADGGIGIGASLQGNPTLATPAAEWTAIELAVQELVSGTSSRTRGIGLYSVFDEMHRPGRELMIHSGNGVLTVNADSEIHIVRGGIFPGTLVYAVAPA